MQDKDFMLIAYKEAEQAAAEDEVPVGAILVRSDQIIAQDHNRIVQRKDPLAHAELLTMESAIRSLGEKWLLDCTLYVTLEPCVMCAGALVLARLKRLVFATPDQKAGAAGSVYDLVRSPLLNHRLELSSGPLQQECSSLLSNFFQKLRQKEDQGSS
jgi:tRNA(adenine34) deaminase